MRCVASLECNLSPQPAALNLNRLKSVALQHVADHFAAGHLQAWYTTSAAKKDGSQASKTCHIWQDVGDEHNHWMLSAAWSCCCAERMRCRGTLTLNFYVCFVVLKCAPMRQDVWARSTVAVVSSGLKLLVRSEEAPPKAPAAPAQPAAAPSRTVTARAAPL